MPQVVLFSKKYYVLLFCFFSLAQNKLNGIVSSDIQVNDWLTLHSILLSLYIENKSVYELTEIEVEQIREIANRCPAGLGTANAQSLLMLLFGEKVPECPLDIETRSLTIKQNDSVIEDDTDNNDLWLGENYPDPFNDKTVIEYSVPKSIEGKIVVVDTYGRTVLEYPIESNKNQLVIEKANFVPGLYSYSLLVNGVVQKTKRMIVQ
ncbi:MAG: hypothetical protein A2W91_20360 [Bacteroidetes bacterium GWF2_38_335]|nr:MAG: hypothetical protein A2W91_20360 [Bacteroidetes bacterium GWF2_38_335]OFY79486.1 MAG: hypothetical protein A2281_13725 [Bacteroidetes bacterium RIFOXYA12_FULL_38_20]HBS86576.1 hypothetical protein [Bacteroidales bacterium]